MNTDSIEALRERLLRTGESFDILPQRLALFLAPHDAAALLETAGLRDLRDLEKLLGARIWLDLSVRPGEFLIGEAARLEKYTL